MKVQYCVCNSVQPDTILSCMNSAKIVYIPLISTFIPSSHLCLCPLSGAYNSDFLIKILYAHLISLGPFQFCRQVEAPHEFMSRCCFAVGGVGRWMEGGEERCMNIK
jgi:hypothetical protein